MLIRIGLADRVQNVNEQNGIGGQLFEQVRRGPVLGIDFNNAVQVDLAESADPLDGGDIDFESPDAPFVVTKCFQRKNSFFLKVI